MVNPVISLRLDDPVLRNYQTLAQLQERSIQEVIMDVLREGAKHFAPLLPPQQTRFCTLTLDSHEISLPAQQSGLPIIPPPLMLQLEALLVLATLLELQQTTSFFSAVAHYCLYASGDNPFPNGFDPTIFDDLLNDVANHLKTYQPRTNYESSSQICQRSV